MSLRHFRPLALTAAALSLAAPAFAQDMPPQMSEPEAQGHGAAVPKGNPDYGEAAYERARADWLAECRHRHGSGATVGGAGADRREARDYCEAYLDRHTGYAGYGYPGYVHAYAMRPMLVMVPIAAAAKPHECKETVVTEEWVDVPARRVVPPRPRPSKRVPVIPDKRVRVN